MPGFEAREIGNRFSLRASTTGALLFDAVRVPEANLLPGSTVGLKAPLSCLTHARCGIARGVLGGAGISAEYVPIRHALNLERVISCEGTETIHQLTPGRELTGISAS